jgi:hypothetical protein
MHAKHALYHLSYIPDISHLHHCLTSLRLDFAIRKGVPPGATDLLTCSACGSHPQDPGSNPGVEINFFYWRRTNRTHHEGHKKTIGKRWTDPFCFGNQPERERQKDRDRDREIFGEEVQENVVPFIELRASHSQAHLITLRHSPSYSTGQGIIKRGAGSNQLHFNSTMYASDLAATIKKLQGRELNPGLLRDRQEY